MSEIAVKLHTLFAGNPHCRGIAKTKHRRANGKLESDNQTNFEPITTDHWEKHLSGEERLGVVIIIPPRNEVFFGALDVDVYDETAFEYILSLVKFIHFKNIPLVPCYSKSGGVHFYLFTKEAVPAYRMRQTLQRLASHLGIVTDARGKKLEIFPKQDEVDHEKGSVGSWLNMPYFDAYRPTKESNFSVAGNGDRMAIEDFIEVAYKRRVSLDQLIALGKPPESVLKDAPPCLDEILGHGIVDGHRNVVLFNVGLYYKRRFPNIVGDKFEWESHLLEFNETQVQPALPRNEMEAIIGSVRNGNHNYQCNSTPLCNSCDKATCTTRQYGVAYSPNEAINIVEVEKTMTDPVLWSITTSIGSLMLTTDQLDSSSLYRKACIEQLGIMPQMPKADKWREVIGAAITKAHVVYPQEALCKDFDMLIHLRDFCDPSRMVDQREAESVDPIHLLEGKPVLIRTVTSDVAVMFRAESLQAHIRQKGVMLDGRKWVKFFRDRSIREVRYNLIGIGKQVYQMPYSIIKEDYEFRLASQQYIRERNELRLQEAVADYAEEGSSNEASII